MENNFFIYNCVNRHDEICLAKCNDQWYRAKLAKSYGDKQPVMLFIDFLIYNKVHVNNMRPMPVEFKFPRYSVFVEIGGELSTFSLTFFLLLCTLVSFNNLSVRHNRSNEFVRAIAIANRNYGEKSRRVTTRRTDNFR